MFGAFNEFFKIFQGLGVEGAIIIALLAVIAMQYRLNLALLKSNDQGRAALLTALENSTAAQRNVAVVLSRMESKMGLESAL